MRSRALVVGDVHTRSRSLPRALDEQPLLRAQRSGSALLTGSQLRFSGGHLVQPLLPFPLEATCDQPLLGIDGSVAAFRTRRFIAGAFDGHPRLRQRGIVIGFQALGSGHRRAYTGWGTGS